MSPSRHIHNTSTRYAVPGLDSGRACRGRTRARAPPVTLPPCCIFSFTGFQMAAFGGIFTGYRLAEDYESGFARRRPREGGETQLTPPDREDAGRHRPGREAQDPFNPRR